MSGPTCRPMAGEMQIQSCSVLRETVRHAWAANAYADRHIGSEHWHGR
jgi:hypothetical protein